MVVEHGLIQQFFAKELCIFALVNHLFRRDLHLFQQGASFFSVVDIANIIAAGQDVDHSFTDGLISFPNSPRHGHICCESVSAFLF